MCHHCTWPNECGLLPKGRLLEVRGIIVRRRGSIRQRRRSQRCSWAGAFVDARIVGAGLSRAMVLCPRSILGPSLVCVRPLSSRQYGWHILHSLRPNSAEVGVGGIAWGCVDALAPVGGRAWTGRFSPSFRSLWWCARHRLTGAMCGVGNIATCAPQR